MHEVRDVEPPPGVGVAQVDGVAEHRPVRLHPQRVHALDRQLALAAARGVQLLLEARHHDLAEHRREGVLELPAQQREPHRGVALLAQQAPEHQHLAEHAGGLGGGERRVLLEEPPVARQVLVHAVAELVGQGHHVAQVAGVVEQHVGVRRGHRGGREGAAALPRPQLGVDPAAREEALGDLRHLGREVAVGGQHHRARLVPRAPPLDRRHRRVAVVVLEPVEAEQAALQPVVAVHEVVARLAGLHQRGHRLGLDLVGEVALGGGIGVAAQAVAAGLVLHQRVEHEREQARVGAQALGERVGGAAAGLAIGVVEEREQLLLALLDRAVRALEAEAQRRQRLVEQARPGARARVGELLEDLLLGLGEQVRPVAAHRREEVAAARERGVGEPLLGLGVVERHPLELEEHERVADLARALLHALEQGAVARRRRIGGEQQLRVGAGPVGGLLERLELVERSGQLGGGERRHAPAVALGEALGGGQRVGEVTLDARVVGAGVEVGEVPGDPGGGAGIDAVFGDGCGFAHLRDDTDSARPARRPGRARRAAARTPGTAAWTAGSS